MKNDAIVSNILNRNSVIIKTNKTSVVINQNMEELRETFSQSLPYIKKIDNESAEMASSQAIKTSVSTLLSKNKVDMPAVNVIEACSAATLGKYKIRYVRDWVNGSNVDGNSHWVEIMVKEKSTGNNLSLNKPATFVNNVNVSASRAVDGNTHYNNHFGVAGKDAIEVDLQQEYTLEDLEITVWHYYGDGRIYKDTKIEVSNDKKTWFTLRDSEVDGRYSEVASGMTVRGGNHNVIKHEYADSLKSDITTITPSINELVGSSIIYAKDSLISAMSDKSILNKYIDAIQCNSINIDEGIATENIFLTSKDKKSNNYNVINNFRCASTVVSTKIPVDTTGSNGSGGEGLKSLDLELIPFNYVKIKIDFTDRKVVDAIGLPPGLTVRDGFIDGSPAVSGDYNAKILLDNNTFIAGKIKVHVLDRII